MKLQIRACLVFPLVFACAPSGRSPDLGAIDLGKAEGRNLLALPMGRAGWPQDGLRPAGALEKVKVSLGLDFKFEAYSGTSEMQRRRATAAELDPVVRCEFCFLGSQGDDPRSGVRR
jgi:hypothetical protein